MLVIMFFCNVIHIYLLLSCWYRLVRPCGTQASRDGVSFESGSGCGYWGCETASLDSSALLGSSQQYRVWTCFTLPVLRPTKPLLSHFSSVADRAHSSRSLLCRHGYHLAQHWVERAPQQYDGYAVPCQQIQLCLSHRDQLQCCKWHSYLTVLMQIYAYLVFVPESFINSKPLITQHLIIRHEQWSTWHWNIPCAWTFCFNR